MGHLRTVSSYLAAVYVGVACLFHLPFWLVAFWGWWVGGTLYALLIVLVAACAIYEFAEWQARRYAPNPERDWNTFRYGGS